MVHYAGESGIDTGALAKEYLTSMMSDIAKHMFPDGSPVDSMLNVHNENLITCGQIAAVSVAQGGPAPQFLDECVYETLVNDEVDMKNLETEKHFTKTERELLNEIVKHPLTYQDFIMEHGYTGVISENGVENIIGTLRISIISRRIIYLKEFWKGLELYNFTSLIKDNSEICKSLFVRTSDTNVDANYIVTLLSPVYSDPDSTRRVNEEQLLDHFQDFLMSLEDENVFGETEALAWCEGESDVAESAETFAHADLTPAGVLGWLTGQKHKPINGESLSITVNFDHDCLDRYPKHRICFPVVGSCGRSITLPVAHMKTCDDFRKAILTALCKGQSFSLV